MFSKYMQSNNEQTLKRDLIKKKTSICSSLVLTPFPLTLCIGKIEHSTLYMRPFKRSLYTVLSI